MEVRSVLAVAAHPDDIEFMMAGTLLLLRKAGYQVHYLNVATGSCGSLVHRPSALRRIRRGEAMRAAGLLGATFHESRVDDLEILYSVPLLRWLTGVVREVKPSIVLTHSPEDYMEDHMITCRLAVTAAFSRGIPNFHSTPRRHAWSGDTVIYHAMPHQLRDGLGRTVVPESFVDTASVQQTKLEALACHSSQHSWLQASQGMNSYLRQMQEMATELGKRSGRFQSAEGWRRHSHVGFSPAGADPLRTALGRKYLLNPAYKKLLAGR